ncbi:MAG: outer membrane beta-barrel protein [Bacteroidota bacterium]
MKTKFTLVLVMLFALTATKMYAQTKDVKKLRIGLGVEGALPVGAWSSGYNIGAGATLRIAYALNETSAITATTGAIAFIPKSITGVNTKASLNIPIKAGYKYMLSDSFYGLGEAGFTIAKSYYPTGTGSLASVSSTNFTYSVGVGTHLGAFDPSIRYEGYSGAGFIGLRLGFNF